MSVGNVVVLDLGKLYEEGCRELENGYYIEASYKGDDLYYELLNADSDVLYASGDACVLVKVIDDKYYFKETFLEDNEAFVLSGFEESIAA